MHKRLVGTLGLVAALMPAALAAAASDAEIDRAFEALKSYDWGQDREVLRPIDEAVAASRGDVVAQKSLEMRLAAALKSDGPRASKDFICRKLSLVGGAGCVPVLSELLAGAELSHMARYALERIPADEAGAALRDALPKVDGLLKVGVINSLGVRRDAPATAALVALLGDSDPQIASAAAAALGSIGSTDAAKALKGFQANSPKELNSVAADAYLACAERLLADGRKVEAMVIYKELAGPEQPKHVRMAATRGLLSVAGKE